MIDPRLKPRQITLIWESDFSKMVSEVYGRPYRFQQQGDMKGQDSIEKFEVSDFDDETDPDEYFRGAYSLPSLADWLAAEPPTKENYSHAEELRWDREFYPPFEEVVHDLYKRGLIDKGNYALHIWW